MSKLQQSCSVDVATFVVLGCSWPVKELYTIKVMHKSLCSGGKAASISSEADSDNILAGCLCRYDKFSFDVTQALQQAPGNHHELLLEVTDPSGMHSSMPLVIAWAQN